MIQTYCFRFYFRSVSVIILSTMGHAGFCFLVRRCLLSVFGRACPFAQGHHSAPAPQFDENWECCASLAVNLRRLWNPNVWCVDAAPRGCYPVWSAVEIGRLEERWRWKLTSGLGPGPRELALADVSEDVVNKLLCSLPIIW